MSSRYKIHDPVLPYFVTCTVVQWIDALTRADYKNIICQSLQHCCVHKGLRLHAWVIMSNHLHLIVSAAPGSSLSGIMRDFKKYTATQVVKAIAANPQESRKQWLLNAFRFAGHNNSSNKDIQFWQQNFHPVCLDTPQKCRQRLEYVHQNPVRAGWVWQPPEYKYSSALDYYTTEKGVLPLVRLEW